MTCVMYCNAVQSLWWNATVGCYEGGAWVNSLSYADDMVLLAPTVTALQTLLEVCRAYAGPHDIVTTQRKQYVCWSYQSNHRVGTQENPGSEVRNLTLSRNFVTQDMSLLQTVEMTRILKNNSGGKMQLAICWSGTSHLHLWIPKFNCSSHVVLPVKSGCLKSVNLLHLIYK